MNHYLLLADLVAVFHAAYVAFVTIGFVLIAIGIAMRWEWVRAFWFRAAHSSLLYPPFVSARCDLLLTTKRRATTRPFERQGFL